jgi:transposase
MSEARTRLEYEVVRRFARGERKRAIARTLGIDRKTVRRVLKDNAARRTEGEAAEERSAAAPRRSKLDAHADFINELLRLYPDIRAKRVLEELEERGFDGGYTIVREYLKRTRPRPASESEEYQLVETPPGKQAQVDWAHGHLADATKLYALLVTLGFSRYQYIEHCTDMLQPTIFRVLIRAFEDIGGVLAELVFDSMPGIVDRWEAGVPVLNLRALDFAAYYHFSYHIAPRNDPEYKGKAERNVRTWRESFLNGRTLISLEDSNLLLRQWLDRRHNPRKHPKRPESRRELLAQEGLQPLPPVPYDARETAWRLVDAYGYVRFEHNFYRAPHGWVGRWVCLRAGERDVELYGPLAQPLARHERAPRGVGRYVPPPEPDAAGRRRVAELMERFAAWGEAPQAWARQLRQRKRYAGVELARVAQMQESYGLDDLLAAIGHALRYGAYDAQSIARILEAQATPRTARERLNERARDEIRRRMATAPVQQRGTAAYGRLLAGSAPTRQTPQDE